MWFVYRLYLPYNRSFIVPLHPPPWTLIIDERNELRHIRSWTACISSPYLRQLLSITNAACTPRKMTADPSCRWHSSRTIHQQCKAASCRRDAEHGMHCKQRYEPQTRHYVERQVQMPLQTNQAPSLCNPRNDSTAAVQSDKVTLSPRYRHESLQAGLDVRHH